MSDEQAVQFPKTLEEFMERYKMVDTKRIYSNGTEYVPIFRMKQWFDQVVDVEKKNNDLSFRQLREEINELHYDLCRKDGEIAGLRFALRCNGVSGGDVRG